MESNLNLSEVLSLVARIPGVDARYAADEIGGPETFVKMLLQMARIMPSNIKQMDECLAESGDLSLFKVKVHGAKGSLRQAGYLRLSLSAEALEKEAAAGNVQYCRENYGCFREELLCFLEQLSSILKRTGDAPPAEAADIGEYTDMLVRVKAAIEDFDSLLALEFLTPLTAKRFGGGADAVIASVYDELENYRPEAALEHIRKLV